MTDIIHADPFCPSSDLFSVLRSEGRHRLACWTWFAIILSSGLVKLVGLVSSISVELFVELSASECGRFDETVDGVGIDHLTRSGVLEQDAKLSDLFANDKSGDGADEVAYVNRARPPPRLFDCRP